MCLFRGDFRYISWNSASHTGWIWRKDYIFVFIGTNNVNCLRISTQKQNLCDVIDEQYEEQALKSQSIKVWHKKIFEYEWISQHLEPQYI